jgi:hypothetical protein
METRAMEQNRRARNKTTQPAILSLTKEPKTYNGEKTISSTNGAGKTRYVHAED